MRSSAILRTAFAICCLCIGTVFFIAAHRNGRNYGRPELLIAGQLADASAENFRDKLSDQILEILEHNKSPEEVLVLNGLGKRTSFWVGLSNANSHQFFDRPLRGSAKRVIVRSTDEDRKMAGGLTKPIGLGCGLSEESQSRLKRLEPGEVSPIEPCTGAYNESEGISGFVDAE